MVTAQTLQVIELVKIVLNFSEKFEELTCFVKIHELRPDVFNTYDM